MHRPAQPSSQRFLVLALFFLSGALALVYQVVWTRLMTHVFGSTAVAVGTVLAAFMAGLALGSWYFGRVADRVPNRLRLYAWLELGIAAAALLSHLALDRLDGFYPLLYGLTGGFEPLVAALRFLCAFLLVMAPTVLMGATLPALARVVVDARDRVGARLGSLYALNTFGAVCGVLLTGFFLIGRYGLHVTVGMAVVGNLLIGLLAWLASRRGAPPAAEGAAVSRAAPSHGVAPVSAGTLRLVLVGLGISGFTSFAYEIYWTRSLVFILGNSTYALTTMLSAFLTGIALGGWGARLVIAASRDRVAAFGWLQVALGGLSAVALPALFAIAEPQALEGTLMELTGEAVPLVLASFGIAFVVMLVPAMLIGATFPLVGQLAVRELDRAGETVGRVYAVNTAGNVLGALAPGWFLLDWLGIQRGIVAMALINVLLGLVILAVRLWRPERGWAWRLAVPLAAMLALGVMTRAPLDFRFPADGEQAHFRTLFYREGPLATTKVQLDPANGEKHMSVDGIVIGGTGTSEFKQLLLAHLPKLLLDEVSPELSVGLGSGILAGESLLHPEVRRLTAVEIEPGVIEGAGWFEAENHDVLADPRLQLVEDDVSSFLRTTGDRWRVISADEKTADEYASNGFSYSLDYYQLLRGHLEEHGLVAQWVPATLPPRQFRMILKSFVSSFRHVQLWYFLPAQRRGPFNAILVGSRTPVAIEPDAIQTRFDRRREALASLEPYGLTSAQALLPHFVADETVLRGAVFDAPLNTLDHPRYEFYHPWEYAQDRGRKILANHEFLLGLKRQAHDAYFASLVNRVPDPERLERTFAAEFAYLEAFRQFLSGLSVADHYRLFDRALAIAPWNDSLRARIYAQYAFLATAAQTPAERRRRAQRARDVLDGLKSGEQ